MVCIVRAMHPTSSLLAGSLALASLSVLTACAISPTEPLDPEIPPPPSAPACVPEPQSGVTIVGCGFGPSLGVLAADDSAVYAVSATHSYFALERASGTVTALFRSPDGGGSPAALAGATVVHDHALFFPSLVDVAGGVTDGIVSIDGRMATTSPRVVMTAQRYAPRSSMIADGQRLYWASIDHHDGAAFVGPVVAMGFDGSALRPVTSHAGEPIAVVGDELAYRQVDQVLMVPIAGGVPRLIASGLSDASRSDRAVDEGHVYATLADAPYQIWRFPTAGGPAELVVEASAGGEIQLEPPHDLRRDGDSLYFMQRVAGELEFLYRLRLDDGSPVQLLASAAEASPPVFDASSIYIAYQRGGFDAPIEGVIARIAK